MSSLPQVSGRTTIAALKKVGFVVLRQNGDHCFFNSRKPLKKGTLHNALKNAGLSVDEFRDLILASASR